MGGNINIVVKLYKLSKKLLTYAYITATPASIILTDYSATALITTVTSDSTELSSWITAS